MSRIIGVIILFYLLGLTFAWFENCDYVTNLQLGETVQIASPNYPNSLPSGTSCRYKVTAPSGTRILLQCQIKMAAPSSGSCKDASFYIASDGNSTLSTSESFCGTGSVTRYSYYSQLVLAYTSYLAAAGSSFQCTVTVQPGVCDCGWSVNTRIVGGVVAGVNEYTSAVGLVDLQKSAIFCGGTIISPTMVLTAASCLKTYVPSKVAMLAGESDITIGTESPYTQLYRARKFIIHPMYSTTTSQNDIALIETIEQIMYTRGVGPACLPFSLTGQSLENTNVEAAGWGTMEYGGPTSNTLRKVSLRVISNSQCGQSYTQITQSQMCTYTAGKDTCQIDTGGPLYMRGNRLFLVGIISYGRLCGTSTPTVNTRITSYLTWISQNVTPTVLCSKTFA